MVNKVEIIGRLGADPEVKMLDNGNKLARISVGTNEVWNDKNGVRQEETSWHNITIFGKLAENAEKILQKGSLVRIEAKLKYRTTENESGEKKRYTDLNATEFKILADGRKNEANPANTSTTTTQSTEQSTTGQNIVQSTAKQAVMAETDDDLPF